MNAPTALADPPRRPRRSPGGSSGGLIGGKPVFACWMGGAAARDGARALRAAGVASYDTPAAAAAAVGHLTDWGRAQAALLRVPDRAAEADAAAPRGGARPGAALFARRRRRGPAAS